ncbi:MAG: hypothetical protein STSR0008_25850 [Ignavibacterium sp.]
MVTQFSSMGTHPFGKRKLVISSKAPDFCLKNIDEKFYSLKSFVDKKTLLIIFTCNHCPFSQRLMEIHPYDIVITM